MQGLFGMTPQDIQAARMAEMNQSAVQQAQLDPQQLAVYGAAMAGKQFGGALRGLFGGQDPQEAKVLEINKISSQIQWNDPESIMRAAQQLSSMGHSREAMALMQKAQEAQLGAAQVGKETALRDKAKAEAAATQMGVEGRAKFLMSRIEGLTPEMAMGLATDEKIAAELLKQPKVETQVVETAEGQILINKQTGQKIANIGRSPDRATRVNVNASPIIKQGTDVVGLVSKFEDLTKPQRDMLRSAETAKTLINEASTSNNSQSWEAARTQLAKAVGESKLSNEDIRRTGNDPRLVQGALDWINKKVSGVPNQDIMRQLYVVASLLEKTSVERINKSTAQVRNLATAAGVEGDMSVLFPEVTSSGGGSSGGVVDWSQLK